MSVINQMLKDLDDRQGEQLHSHTQQPHLGKQGSPWKLITIIVVILIALNILGIFIWQLYSENRSLQNLQDNSYVQNQKAQKLVKGLDNTLNTEATSEKTNTLIQPVNVEANALAANEAKENAPTVTSLENTTVEQQEIVQKIPSAQQKQSTESNLVNNQASNISSVKKQPERQTKGSDSASIRVDVSEVKAENEALLTEDKPQLSISRKQLTAAELTQQKIDQAEQALAENKLSSAEKLFEDVILMTPEHKIARKKLAALWFGRQAYQPAINLLSQGIGLYPEDSEFRLMKARIYFNQGQTAAGVNTLKALPKVENIEYQALLASHAQQISQFDMAATAYQLLTTLEPDAGRWWLGLAVAYDSNSEFEQAIRAYQQAITKNDLSDNARQFARQRVQELGE